MAATTPLMHPGDPAKQRAPLFFGASFSATNSLNLIRLVLALSVLVAHSYPLTGRPEQVPKFGSQDLGAWAVAGFFAISGYLITASRQRTGFAHFLLLRIGRIYPAFIVVMLVTVVLFAPIAQLVTEGTLSGYRSTGPTPFTYIYQNLFLDIKVYAVGDTLSTAPYPDAWNGSLWTLYYEFLCYLFVGVFLIWKRARTSVWPIAVAFVLSVVAYSQVQRVVMMLDGDDSARLFSMLLPYFLGGALIRLLKPYIGLHWIAGCLSLVIVVLAVVFGPPWAPQAVAPLFAYALLWLSTVIPQPRWIARNDISYGAYVYAFPVQQLLAVFGLWQLNLFLYMVIAFAVTLPFAAASWFWVERPALQRARLSIGRPADRPTQPPAVPRVH